jgi:hypothetical protein
MGVCKGRGTCRRKPRGAKQGAGGSNRGCHRRQCSEEGENPTAWESNGSQNKGDGVFVGREGVGKNPKTSRFNGGQDKGDGVFVGKEGVRENPMASRSNRGQDKGDGDFVGK